MPMTRYILKKKLSNNFWRYAYQFLLFTNNLTPYIILKLLTKDKLLGEFSIFVLIFETIRVLTSVPHIQEYQRDFFKSSSLKTLFNSKLKAILILSFISSLTILIFDYFFFNIKFVIPLCLFVFFNSVKDFLFQIKLPARKYRKLVQLNSIELFLKLILLASFVSMFIELLWLVPLFFLIVEIYRSSLSSIQSFFKTTTRIFVSEKSYFIKSINDLIVSNFDRYLFGTGSLEFFGNYTIVRSAITKIYNIFTRAIEDRYKYLLFENRSKSELKKWVIALIILTLISYLVITIFNGIFELPIELQDIISKYSFIILIILLLYTLTVVVYQSLNAFDRYSDIIKLVILTTPISFLLFFFFKEIITSDIFSLYGIQLIMSAVFIVIGTKLLYSNK